MEIISFGKIAEITGNRFMLEGITDTDALRAALMEQYPLLRGMKYMIAVDKKQVQGIVEFNEDAEVALMPPFSGG